MIRRYYDKPPHAQAESTFRTEGFVRDGVIPWRNGGDFPLQRLPAFLRALLVTDGTVTKILEAYFWEPVEVATLQQEFVSAERPIGWIQVGTGDRVMIRRVRLQGRDSGRTYATAFSVIRIELIPEGFRQRLIDREIGIGVLIRDSGLESYREVLEVGVEQQGTSASEAPMPEAVYRTYRIIIGREPVIVITESFPLTPYR